MKLLISALVLSLVGCGSAVEIPPAHVGKVLTKNGYSPEIKPPSKFRLPACVAYCDKLVVMEVSDKSVREQMEIFVPKDRLNVKVDVRAVISIPSDPDYVNSVFDRVPTEDNMLISNNKVYLTYGQQAVRGIVRSEIVKYTISELMNNRESISASIHNAITNKMKKNRTPLILSRFQLANIQPPSIIVEAQEKSKEREIEIKTAEAQAEIELVKAEKALEIAKKNRLVEREKARGIAEQNVIAAKSITPQLLAYRKLEVAENIYRELAKSDNVIIVPADSSGFSNLNGDAVLSKLLGKELRK